MVDAKKAIICNAHCLERYGSTHLDVIELEADLREKGYAIGKIGCTSTCNIVGDNYSADSIVNVLISNPDHNLDKTPMIAGRRDDGSIGMSRVVY